jgi:intracellular septation protein
MKALFDFFPVILFYAAYQLFDIYIATSVLILASCGQVLTAWLVQKKIEKMHLIVLATVLILGIPTLLLRNELFIKWKPTVVNWIAALVFSTSHLLRRPLIQTLLKENFALPEAIWRRLNLSWISFFILMGLANLYVIYHFDTKTWVNFKLFGVLGLTICFAIAQGFYLTQHLGQEDKNR